ERKLEAAERLEEAKKEAAKLKTELEAVEKELSPKLLSTLGEAFSSSLKEAVTALENLEKLEFGASGFEETARNFAKTVHNLSRSYEALEAVERFMGLQHVKALMEEIRKAKPEEVESLFNRSRELVEVTPARYMAMLERGLKLVHLEHRIKLLTEEPLKVKGMLDELASKSSQIHAYKELVDIELTLENLKKRFMQTGKTMVFEAWVPKGRVEEAVKAIRQACPEALVSTNREEREEKVPTLLVNPKPIICFEKLVSSYSLPSYYEIDPTLIMLVTFPIIFGFMFGDMGHGLVLLVGSLLIKPLFDRMKIRNEMLDYLYKGRNLVFLCGITSIIIGFLYGDFFGPTNAAYAAHHGTPTWYTAITGVEDAPWFSPMDEPMMLFKIAIFIGIAQITFGLILDIVNNIAAREYKEILAPASWLWFYGSLSYLIITYGFGIANVLFETDKLLAFFVVPFAGLFILHKLAGKSGMETFAEGVEKAIASISNTLSYGRILALGLAHAIFSDLALMGKGLLFWPIFLIVTIFIITALEGILTFAHTLRLHWVEWFSKFYRGEGTPFEGFKIERRFTVTA
ncbi:MAG: V-type ATP synthase subunit I, partial [Candidatus Hecatellaceae archaeon]